MSFQNLSVNASSGASIPIIDHSQPATRSVGVGMYPSLMGTFSCPAIVLMIGSSSGGASSSLSSVSFHTTHMEGPWILPCRKFQLGVKTVMIEVKVVDAPLDYNLLLGRNWMYSMQVVAS